MTTYYPDRDAIFFTAKGKYGALVNMAGGMPLTVNGRTYRSAEHLYQCCKFLEDFHQWAVAAVPSGMFAAKLARKLAAKHERPNWDELLLPTMEWVLTLKLLQHWARVGAVLDEARPRRLVEQSTRDTFWGAVPSDTYEPATYRESFFLEGDNNLGKLWNKVSEARDRALGRPHWDRPGDPPGKPSLMGMTATPPIGLLLFGKAPAPYRLPLAAMAAGLAPGTLI